jgi:hypothetical protein
MPNFEMSQCYCEGYMHLFAIGDWWRVLSKTRNSYFFLHLSSLRQFFFYCCSVTDQENHSSCDICTSQCSTTLYLNETLHPEIYICALESPGHEQYRRCTNLTRGITHLHWCCRVHMWECKLLSSLFQFIPSKPRQ